MQRRIVYVLVFGSWLLAQLQIYSMQVRVAQVPVCFCRIPACVTCCCPLRSARSRRSRPPPPLPPPQDLSAPQEWHKVTNGPGMRAANIPVSTEVRSLTITTAQGMSGTAATNRSAVAADNLGAGVNASWSTRTRPEESMPKGASRLRPRTLVIIMGLQRGNTGESPLEGVHLPTPNMCTRI